MIHETVYVAMQTNGIWTGDAQDFFARQHDDHMQKYRWNKMQFKDIISDELLRAAGLKK